MRISENVSEGWTPDMDKLLLERKDGKRLPWRSVAPIGPMGERKCQTRYRYLKELEARGERAPVRTSLVAAERALEQDDAGEDGVEWLLKKGRLSARRYRAAVFYRKAFRDGGGLSIRSSADIGTGGGAPGPGLHQENASIAFTQALKDLHTMRTGVLWNQDDLVTVCDAICGIGRTPRGLVGGDGHKAATIEAVLMVALDLLARWLDVRTRAGG